MLGAVSFGSFVYGRMPTFQILHFRESVLEHAEEVDARDVLEAIERAAGKPPDQKVEVWIDHRRVAEIGRSPVYPFVSKRRTST